MQTGHAGRPAGGTGVTAPWWRRAAGIGVAALLGGAAWQAQEPPPAWLARTGTEWERETPAARAAYLEGFVAGAAVAQAAAAGAADSAAVLAAIARLRREGGLAFPYAPTVYGSRLADHLWWENHRQQPVWWALWQVNDALRPGAREGR